jgi:hypothetical protein
MEAWIRDSGISRNGPHIHAQPFFMIPVLRDAKYSNLNQ